VFTRSRIGLALAVGAIAATAFSFWPRTQSPVFFFELTMRSALSGFAQLYYDTGSGINEADSFRLHVAGGNHDVDYKFELPAGQYSKLRFDPTDRAGNTMTLSKARIVDRSGQLFRAISPTQIRVSQQIELLEVSETAVSLVTAANADDPILTLELGQPLGLKSFAQPSFRTILRRFLLSLFFATALALLAAPLVSKITPNAARWTKAVATWGTAHPVRLLLATAALAVVASCYPIVFLGKSFLSPNNHSSTYLLYGEMPTVPGSKEAVTDDEKGSDLGAPMWYSWPTSVVESRSLFKDFELPLWNRYDCSGVPLLGQGQSMFGDPLHFLVLAAGGSAGAWDLKYLLAKFLFAACLGLCVFQLTRHLPASAIIAASAPFIGFFAYRYSHPAFFSMCYAPSVMLCWLKLIDAPARRASALWLGMMVLANWTVMNSGTVKEAYMLLLTLNLCGCLTLLLAARKAERILKLRQAFVAQSLFLLIATPVWLTFLWTLRNAWTVYDTGAVFQISPALLIGLFDDIFYRQFNANELHLDPSANFLVLAGVLWFCLSRRRNDRPRLTWGAGIVCLVALGFVFGIVPPSLILRIPFLGNIYHIDNTFSCVAIICLLLLAGCGIKAFWDDCRTLDFRQIYVRYLVALAGLLALYFGTTEAAQRSTKTLLQVGEHIPKSNFFWGYTVLLVAAVVLGPWLGRLALTGNRTQTWRTLSLVLLFVLIHWKQGMHGTTPFDAYVMNPHPRTDLLAESPAVRTIKDRSAEPWRSAGLNYDLFPGYGGAIGLEQIDSPDALLNKYYKSLMDASGVMLLFCSARGGWIDNQLSSDLPLFDMLNVRFFLGGPGSKGESIPSFQKIASLDLNVFESSKAWPRAFFTNRVTPYDSESDFVRLLKEGDGKPFAAIQRREMAEQTNLETLMDPSPSPNRRFVPATGYHLTNNNTSFKVTAPEAGVMVLTEPYVENDFQLLLDGKPATYFRVNSAFRGVFLPAPGDYTFAFSYWPRHLTISLWISAIGIVSLLLWLGTFFKSKPRQA
jgi:hypothetical protein